MKELAYAGTGIKFSKSEAELFSHKQIFDVSSLLSVCDVKGNIIFANDKFCEASKYSHDELLGRSHGIIYHPDTPSSLFEEMRKTTDDGKVWQGEMKNIAKDGSSYWTMATIAPVLGNTGKPVKYISMLVDITKQKLAEDELKIANKKINQELYENVNYAKHIHNSFLTPEDELKSAFPDSFLIYKAQTIISGDFYMVGRTNNQSVIVLGDSTGHGVAASYISIMVLNSLARLMYTGCNNSSELLRATDLEINEITHLNKKHPIRETADTIICCIDHNQMQMNYSSAKMKGVVISDDKLIMLERNRCSIGECSEKDIALATYNLPLKKDDCIYLFSDGMTDQMGGSRNKKFKNRQLMELLLANSAYPMQFQKANISKVITEWQGDNEQTDDMTLLGLRVS